MLLIETVAIESCLYDAYACVADRLFILLCSLGREGDVTVEDVGLVEDLEFSVVDVSEVFMVVLTILTFKLKGRSVLTSIELTLRDGKSFGANMQTIYLINVLLQG